MSASRHRPHLPMRPAWLCRVCAAPWPCAPARLALLTEYSADLVGLSIYLCSMLYEAAADSIDRSPSVSPAELFRRFVAWVPRD